MKWPRGDLHGATKATNPIALEMKITCNDEKLLFPTKFSKVGIDFLGMCLERGIPGRGGKAEELLNHPFVSKINNDRDFRKKDGSTTYKVVQQ